ncbi:PREDICTED: vacuolar protein sorting-associated protein 51 homolog isoform X3 [Ipomoea nil]|uniref:vacuolar protein sorting-associated protein 51 homolog isoform X3 n=1 Tax=Ipomoea nil TaxID=35883 RepID=UPI0009017248|nr:PREDICTED: vacuolar protein sorting-associated protein 51 homolog isoform X3 [Ipomoea nil]
MEGTKMGVDDEQLDDKAKRMRDLLSSFYSLDPSSSGPPNASSRFATLDTINTSSFDADQYMNLLVQKSNLEGLLQRHVEMAAEIKNLDTDLQMLVYENYNKFISATDTIKRMNNNIVGMETNMEQLLEKIMSVQSRSDGVNTSLFEKREHIEKLHRTRNFLRKVQGKVFSDSESIQARAEAVMLLKQLNYPVENLKVQLYEKLEQFLVDLNLESKELMHGSLNLDMPPDHVDLSDSTSVDQASIREFAEAIRAYRVIFPDSDQHLVRLAEDLVKKHFEATEHHIKKRRSTDLLSLLRIIWTNVLLMDEVLPEAGLIGFSLEAARVSIKKYVESRFSHLLLDITGALVKLQGMQKGVEEEYTLQAALDSSKKTLIEGSSDVLQEFQRLLNEDMELLVKLREMIINWVQEGFQEFFRKLENQFLLLSGKKYFSGQDQNLGERKQGDKILPGLVLVLSQLSISIEQSVIPRITEEIAAFSGGGARGYDYGPAYVPAEICRTFHSAGETFLHMYIDTRTQKLSVVLKKRFTTPNWMKHKEPREVHMFVDLLLQELDAIGNEVKQVLPEGLNRKHRRTDSNGSTTSSRSNPLRDDRLSRSNTQKARSQLLETHLAKLFKQKMEIFTKVEHTQESVMTTIVKLCLKSLQEFARLQTFNRSGFQQIQLDFHFLKTSLKNAAEDEAAVDFLLDEVIVAAAERCIDPVPLEPAILDKLVQVKLAKI